MNIADIRKDYTLKSLEINDVNKLPIKQFEQWFEEAVNAEVLEVNAMTLATVSRQQARARILLLKGVSEQGFTFFTNYESDKGKELEENPNASMVFFWKELERQVRIEGIVEKVSPEESQNYFHSRPRGSQIGAWASQQSSVIKDRDVLENDVVTLTEKYEGKEIEYPKHWGGYILKPHRIEFWQGRSSRLHDRICYELENDNWKTSRLSP
ncbi:MAG: pyridoxamine 5'-phosphate oxidase [Cytophagales bacterium]|nr:pyridoxamine 5'-phosphate oxidase [Cytophagales bacterium]